MQTLPFEEHPLYRQVFTWSVAVSRWTEDLLATTRVSRWFLDLIGIAWTRDSLLQELQHHVRTAATKTGGAVVIEHPTGAALAAERRYLAAAIAAMVTAIGTLEELAASEVCDEDRAVCRDLLHGGNDALDALLARLDSPPAP